MERTIRHSKKREAILSAIRSTKSHPSAEWVYQTLKPTHPDLSLGTVYRNLLFFQEHGDIQSV
ncbi:MAG: transcriptional repressor, partial [Lawsonibacter sp.]